MSLDFLYPDFSDEILIVSTLEYIYQPHLRGTFWWHLMDGDFKITLTKIHYTYPTMMLIGSHTLTKEGPNTKTT